MDSSVPHERPRRLGNGSSTTGQSISSYDNIRPISTGDIGNNPTGRRNKLPKRSSNILSTIIQPSIVDADERNPAPVLRPRATKHFGAVGSDGSHEGGTTTRRDKRVSRHTSGQGETQSFRKQKSHVITDLWDSLSHFSRNNLGRSLTEDVSALGASTDVHFVNIHDSSTDDGDGNGPKTLQSGWEPSRGAPARPGDHEHIGDLNACSQAGKGQGTGNGAGKGTGDGPSRDGNTIRKTNAHSEGNSKLINSVKMTAAGVVEDGEYAVADASSSRGRDRDRDRDRSTRLTGKKLSTDTKPHQHTGTGTGTAAADRPASYGKATPIDEGTPFMQSREPMQTSSGKIKMINSTAFSIPELPRGKKLQINILSTWGDPHYLGLMGIEIFDHNGHPVKVTNPDSQIYADPADINTLPEYDSDPRTVDNLLDGTNHTCDDLHAWLTPFTAGADHFIWIDFDEPTAICMIRVWNYNKSRIHSYRGARYVEISLDDRPIFKGEVRKASGTHSILDYEQCSECILFTRNETILGIVEKYDPVVRLYSQAVDESSASVDFDQEAVVGRGKFIQDDSSAGAGVSGGGMGIFSAAYSPLTRRKIFAELYGRDLTDLNGDGNGSASDSFKKSSESGGYDKNSFSDKRPGNGNGSGRNGSGRGSFPATGGATGGRDRGGSDDASEDDAFNCLHLFSHMTESESGALPFSSSQAKDRGEEAEFAQSDSTRLLDARSFPTEMLPHGKDHPVGLGSLDLNSSSSDDGLLPTGEPGVRPGVGSVGIGSTHDEVVLSPEVSRNSAQPLHSAAGPLQGNRPTTTASRLNRAEVVSILSCDSDDRGERDVAGERLPPRGVSIMRIHSGDGNDDDDDAEFINLLNAVESDHLHDSGESGPSSRTDSGADLVGLGSMSNNRSNCTEQHQQQQRGRVVSNGVLQGPDAASLAAERVVYRGSAAAQGRGKLTGANPSTTLTTTTTTTSQGGWENCGVTYDDLHIGSSTAGGAGGGVGGYGSVGAGSTSVDAAAGAMAEALRAENLQQSRRGCSTADSHAGLSRSSSLGSGDIFSHHAAAGGLRSSYDVISGGARSIGGIGGSVGNRRGSMSAVRPSTAAVVSKQRPIECSRIELCFLSNWGDSYAFGVTGIVALDEHMKEVALPVPYVLLARPNFQNSTLDPMLIPEEQDYAGLANIVRGVNHTVDASHMFCTAKPAPDMAVAGASITLRFEAPTPLLIKGLKIWNFNAGKEGSCCGVKHVNIYLDGRLATKVVVRKALGEFTFDYSQFLPIQQQQNTKGSRSERSLHHSIGYSGAHNNDDDDARGRGGFATMDISSMISGSIDEETTSPPSTSGSGSGKVTSSAVGGTAAGSGGTTSSHKMKSKSFGNVLTQSSSLSPASWRLKQQQQQPQPQAPQQESYLGSGPAISTKVPPETSHDGQEDDATELDVADSSESEGDSSCGSSAAGKQTGDHRHRGCDSKGKNKSGAKNKKGLDVFSSMNTLGGNVCIVPQQYETPVRKHYHHHPFPTLSFFLFASPSSQNSFID